MVTIQDKRNPRYKKLAKQKRSQEDRLLKRKQETTKKAQIELMDSAISMIIDEVRKTLTSSKKGAFERSLAQLPFPSLTSQP
jgi:hypothetical protein|mmetsp:Transcript_36934/g.48568  ORF Transcript_36934/g.48568 Transcript_36934/m.48568 type:complete len:82 (-) Transcript_36934:140-385(-)